MNSENNKKPGQDDKLLNSNYDGIQEYDNDLPKWWIYLFLITIVFSVGYCFYYHLGGPGLSPEQELALEMQNAEKQKALVRKDDISISEDNLVKIVNEQSRIASGKIVYVSRCAACHGPAGQGIVGPNLTDEYWIHGGRISDIKKTVENGVIDKGMLAWKGIIQDEEILDVVAYIWNLKGSNPPNPKAPQGEKVSR